MAIENAQPPTCRGFALVWLVLNITTLSAWGCSKSLNLEGKSCPCVADYVCDQSAQTCHLAQDADVDAALADADASEPPQTENLPTQVTAGSGHTCVKFTNGTIRCWGSNTRGQLGYGSTDRIGDDELPASMPAVDVEGKVTSVHASNAFTCALLDPGNVRCWGSNSEGQLGQGHTSHIGDNEVPSSVAHVYLAGTVVKKIAVGSPHVCIQSSLGGMRCWGDNEYGQLGYAMTESIGDDEAPLAVGLVQVGGTVTNITAGYAHTCALLESGDVRCWGINMSGTLGHGHTEAIGDDELPIHAPVVSLGGKAVQISAGGDYTCALMQSGNVRCWGSNYEGVLGIGNTEDIGDDEVPSSIDPVSLGGKAVQISAGGASACALLESGDVRCWGDNFRGYLGYGHTESIGDDELPSSVDPVSLGGKAVQISVGGNHACALLESGDVRCWGENHHGGLGHGHTDPIGDDELPSSVAPVQVQ